MMMIYKLRLRKWVDDTVSIQSKEELKNLVPKAYYNHVKETFIENQMNYGQDEEEALDAFNDQSFQHIEKWLIKSGFDLENNYKYLGGK